MDFLKFKNKYIITGELEVLNALHIGSGKEEEEKDSPFISDDNGYYIPGSSFRGYLSTKLERILGNDFKLKEKNDGDILNIADVKLIFGYTNLDKEDEDIKNRVLKKLDCSENSEEFNSMAGRIHISDMPIIKIKDDIVSITRDGIKIDRETGATEDKGKFNYDVIPAKSKFELCIELENIEKYQLELIALALKDICGDGDLFGGNLSRGIGKCKIDIKNIEFVDSADKTSLKDYIFEGKLKKLDKKDFFEIRSLDLA